MQDRYLLPPEGEFASILFVAPAFACGLRPGGEKICWGRARDGEVRILDRSFFFEGIVLGEGDACGDFLTGLHFCFMVDAGDLPEEVTGIVQGYNFACGLRPSGEAVCDYFDSLSEWAGRESLLRYPRGESPVEPPPGVFTVLTVGAGFVCGLRPSGEAACWGANSRGESSPPGGRFAKIQAGLSFVCGLRSSGELICWGYGGEQSKALPPRGSFASVNAGWGGLNVNVSEIYEERRDWGVSCGLRSDGSATCWGEDMYETSGWGQAPAWSAMTHWVPQGAFVEAAAGREEACGLRPSGVVECWGAAWVTPEGEPANDTRDAGGEGYAALSVGGEFACGLRRDGSVDCWEAATRRGQGRSEFHHREGPYTVVSAGYAHQCGVLATGDIHCWESRGANPENWEEITIPASGET